MNRIQIVERNKASLILRFVNNLMDFLVLIILNFRFEKKIFKHQNYYLSLSLIFVDFLILLPIIFFTINEAIFLK